MLFLPENTRSRYVVFDLETTGLSAKGGDRIIEIGAVAVTGKEVVEEFHSFINVRHPIHPMAQMVNGITAEMLRGKPKAREVIPAFRHFIKDSILIAHNARFDMKFLQSEFKRLSFDIKNPCFCTMKIARTLYPELPNFKLETVYWHLCSTRPLKLHRALDDARATAKLWIKFEKKVMNWI
ncbi:MAG TPA: 3'-5' exonuclease [Nitrospirota bacterium]|nr:3'-5' exonuclease [Nitrospirota bacterium]